MSLVSFYARRARRLLPAAAVALVATVIASAIFLPPLRVPDIALDGAAAALYVSNMRFAFQATDYLQAAADPSPLLHFWSLGVEEQFYLFWPALLLLVAGRRGRGTIGRLAAIVAIVFGVSLVLSLVLTNVAQPWAFFTLPARAWELALGAALALAAWRRIALPTSLSAPVGILARAIVASGIVLNTTTPFPGVAALLPTFGAALVIAAGLRGPAAGPSGASARSMAPPPAYRSTSACCRCRRCAGSAGSRTPCTCGTGRSS